MYEAVFFLIYHMLHVSDHFQIMAYALLYLQDLSVDPFLHTSAFGVTPPSALLTLFHLWRDAALIPLSRFWRDAAFIPFDTLSFEA